ncbi:hypothetical protein DN752_22985 [Echinicola strongylocentroti]|uniref:Alginate lyase domain-containing protein n=2 Tax=Echinicola strongylocentroti TaxID=1795355 RepID=A0A2Z4IQF1_9BACT|nr:hypothetical protein DN752_22985 [Echinicola strongylocentroti]
MIAFYGYSQSKENIGSPDFSDWSGIQDVEGGIATIQNAQAISYTYAHQNRVYFPDIQRNYFGDAADWTAFSGLAFDLYLGSTSLTEVTAVLKVDSLDYKELNPVSTAKVNVLGEGWHKVYIPWDMFDIDAGQRLGTLYAIKHVSLSVNSNDRTTHQIRNVTVQKGRATYLEGGIQGKSAKAGEKAIYRFEVGNSTDLPQAVTLRIETMGWESMKAKLSNNIIELAPGESKEMELSVYIPDHLPEGIREKQVIKAIANGMGESEATLTFTTAVQLPFPNIVFTPDKWQDVKDKVANYEWAKEGLAAYEEKAQQWKVPKGNDFSDVEGSLLGKSVFNTDGKEILDCAIAYQLTGKEEYAAKCLAVLRRLTDPEIGYPATLVGGGNSFVAEGKFWQSIGRTYDLIRGSELLTPRDRELTDETFRLFVNQTIKGNRRGAISNWNMAEITAALYCALNLQDWHLIEQLLESPTGVYKHIEHGIMNDGWWYECAVGYNTWVATELSEIAIALEPWGINLKDRQFPIGTTKHFSLLASRREGGLMGMQFEKWGKIERNSVGIKAMWDATVQFLDYRGVILAVNDAVESQVAGKPYELAYYLYRDPEYAAVINRGDQRDLLYGVPDLPEVTSEQMKKSTYADNMGIVQLRSQTKGREQREQLQASLHYGSHGGYHGHFDRTSLVNMARYGRSFYGTLAYWFRYQSYLYKFWKQTSINKNMVVVDEKMQLPVENFRTLFHAGEMMQATAVETNSKWSYAPYGGIHYKADQTFAEKVWEEGRSITIPENAPEYGAVTGYTEPVMQRRTMLVMDDYVVLADYLEGEKEHQFDWMLQVKGFKGIYADKVKYSHHTFQMNTDPLGSAQFITDCDWYITEGTTKTQYEMCFGEGCDNRGVRLPNRADGPLKIDVYNAWPRKNEVMIGTSTESVGVNKKLWYTISADGEEVVNDSTGAWILGSKTIALDIAGKKQLELASKTESRVNNNTLFWGNAKVILSDSSEVFLSTLPLTYENILIPDEKGKDYYGGPVKIQGEQMDMSTPAMPEDTKEWGKVKVDLSGLDVVRLEAKVGGDFPLGDETSRLKNMAVRSHGKKARYLAVLEPYENESMVKEVIAKNENELVVKLLDGREQHITLSGMEEGNVSVAVEEYKNGKLIRQEKTK